MGRWFGYRDGYSDLVRIYTTPALQRSYEHIARATEELRLEFEYMVSMGATPKQFGLRVRAHPTMMITSRFKMRQGETLRLSYQGDVSETTVFHSGATVIRANLEAVDRLLQSLGVEDRTTSSGNLVWDGVPADAIVTFLEAFVTHPDAPRADSRRLAGFVKAQNRQDPSELTEWTVALVSKSGVPDDQQRPLGGFRVGLTDRGPVGSPSDGPASRFAIRRLLSPADEVIDLTKPELERAVELTKEYRTKAGKTFNASDLLSGKAVRQARPPGRGLLLLYPLNPSNFGLAADLVPVGIGLSFPTSDSGATIDYVVNRVWRDEDPDYDLL
jgi:hypothetical protein